MPVSENTSVSVLVHATLAQYIHTLNISGTKLPAVYGCSVFNNKPSSAKVIVAIDDSGIIYDYNMIQKYNYYYGCQHRVNGLCFIISLQVPQIQRKSLCPVVNPAL